MRMPSHMERTGLADCKTLASSILKITELTEYKCQNIYLIMPPYLFVYAQIWRSMKLLCHTVSQNSVDSMAFISIACINKVSLIINNLHLSQQMLSNSLGDALKCVSYLQCQCHLLVNFKNYIILSVRRWSITRRNPESMETWFYLPCITHIIHNNLQIFCGILTIRDFWQIWL